MTNLVALQSGTELAGEYRIDRVLGAGGFGITYLADEIALNRLVTIKEYFPSDFAARTAGFDAAPRSEQCAGDYRWGLDRFIEEAQTLAKFSHPNIVRVYRYFRANNTYKSQFGPSYNKDERATAETRTTVDVSATETVAPALPK